MRTNKLNIFKKQSLFFRINIYILFSLFPFVLSASNTIDLLEGGFKYPADSIQTSIYWYWLSDNISEEGVVKDLYSMKKAGIDRAFIGNIGLTDVPYGKVKILSEGWWKILHVALKTATKLNIDIGIFNSPGWSQSGGPWIKPGEAMRYLTSSEIHVKGPLKLSQKLKKPIAIFQDVKVIAYPEPKDNQLVLNTKNGEVSSFPLVSDISKISDGDLKTGISLPTLEEFTINFEADKPFTARSLELWTTETPMSGTAKFQAKDSKGEYITLSEFKIDRYNPALAVGFIPYAPIVISFPTIVSKDFRLVIKSSLENSGLAEIALSAAPKVERFSEKTTAKMFQTPFPYWNEYQWASQAEVDDKATAVDASKVIDISKFLTADGTLNWNVPEGEWIISRTGMTPTGVVNSPASPEATGYETDKMSKTHIEKHFYGHIGEILKRIPEADRKSFKIVVADSYETGSQNFTDGFLELFEKKYGYSALPFLPVYQGRVVNSQMESDRFLWDMRRMVADKVAYDYVGGLRDVSHKNGLTIWLENYGHWGYPGEFLMYGGQSDEIGGEFWSEGDLGNIECRAATSCAHIYGKNKISAESFTCGGNAFARYPATIKQRGDRFFAEGINNTLLHVYITQPYEDKNPGINTGFGTEFNRKNTWFSQLNVFTQYLKRTNFMLQQGLNVADVAYFIGEDTPKMTGIADPTLPVGYQFDYINAEVIEESMTVKNGLLTLPHGTQYRMLVLPKLETMRPELLSKIKQLVYDGAIVLGPMPKRSPSLQNQPMADQQVQAMAKELWGNVDGVNVKSRKVGKGMILNGLDMKQAFAMINCVPDCKLPEDNSIHYGHRTLGDDEIYFITNQTNETELVTPEFRVLGLQPELWEATTGSIRSLPAYSQNGNSTTVPLKLAPNESVFIVFRNATDKPAVNTLEANYPTPVLLNDFQDSWTVQFDASQRGPVIPVIFKILMDWTSSTNDSIKYYSGTAIYSNQFKIKKVAKGQKVFISLGTVTAMAKIYINDIYAGGLWTAPYKLDITKFVKKGENSLKIEVVNTWVNRIIGDSKLPEEQRKTWCPTNLYTPLSPLQKSGLIGPVSISAVKY
ncbi:MAG: glycoside hydrolase family 2 [Paludibacter sp.]|nr:glycoside hydrolase family 2 [Paludibacter sp.]